MTTTSSENRLMFRCSQSFSFLDDFRSREDEEDTKTIHALRITCFTGRQESHTQFGGFTWRLLTHFSLLHLFVLCVVCALDCDHSFQISLHGIRVKAGMKDMEEKMSEEWMPKIFTPDPHHCTSHTLTL